MKRFLLVIAIIVMLLALCGCGYNKPGKVKTQENDGRMTLVYNDGYCVIYRDNETGVHYFSRSYSGSCVMVNADGTPYTGED